MEGQWALTGKEVGSFGIVPAEVPNVPPRTAHTAGSFTLDVPFTCVLPSKGDVGYVPTIEYTERVDAFVEGPAAIPVALYAAFAGALSIREQRLAFVSHQMGTCVAPPGSTAFNSDGGRFSEEILIGTGMQVVVSDRLPITVEVDVHRVRQQTVVIDGDPADVCTNDNTCSTHMDAIDAEPGEKVELTARVAQGNVVAYESLTVPHVVPGRMTFANRGDPRFPRPVSHILIGSRMEFVVSDPTAPLGRVPLTLEVRVLGVVQQIVVIDASDPFCSTLMDAIEAP